MEALSRALVEAQLMSFVDVFSEGGHWDWTLNSMADGVTTARPPDDWNHARFATREGAVLNFFRWLEASAPELERAAVAEARAGIRYRATGHA